jgi:membrane-bound lytic murein transglycosylase F
VQVAAGMKLLHKMNLGWSGIPDIEQRTKFTLASYNAGNGHILDAQRLAAKHGYNPMIWDGHVQLMVANLSSPTYYNDPLVKSGAYRGHADSYANIVYQIYQSWKE